MSKRLTTQISKRKTENESEAKGKVLIEMEKKKSRDYKKEIGDE